MLDTKIGRVKRPLHRFFAYARERHAMYLRRIGNQSKPWTSDPILMTYRFTNVFRELDKTTVWYRQHVREPLDGDPRVLLATVIFRMFNRIETGEAIFGQTSLPGINGVGTSTAWDYFMAQNRRIPLLRQAIKSYVGPKGPYATGAYIISSPPGHSKLDGILEVVDRVSRGTAEEPRTGEQLDWMQVAKLAEHAGDYSLREMFEWMRQFEYLGTFHSYEIVTDLRHTHLLRRAPDVNTWANAGPGAHRGLNRIYGRVKDDDGRSKWGHRVPAKVALTEMREILEKSRDPKLWPSDWPKWELREVEHTLCEFDKYERVRCAEGAPRGVYK